jgi:hypothetical protein
LEPRPEINTTIRRIEAMVAPLSKATCSAVNASLGLKPL